MSKFHEELEFFVEVFIYLEYRSYFCLLVSFKWPFYLRAQSSLYITPRIICSGELVNYGNWWSSLIVVEASGMPSTVIERETKMDTDSQVSTVNILFINSRYLLPAATLSGLIGFIFSLDSRISSVWLWLGELASWMPRNFLVCVDQLVDTLHKRSWLT